MNIPRLIRQARTSAGLTQADLAARAGTSQATVSAYEKGSKQPSVATLARLLAATGQRLATRDTGQVVVTPRREQLERSGRDLLQVLLLAAELPTTHNLELCLPPLGGIASREPA